MASLTFGRDRPVSLFWVLEMCLLYFAWTELGKSLPTMWMSQKLLSGFSSCPLSTSMGQQSDPKPRSAWDRATGVLGWPSCHQQSVRQGMDPTAHTFPLLSFDSIQGHHRCSSYPEFSTIECLTGTNYRLSVSRVWYDTWGSGYASLGNYLKTKCASRKIQSQLQCGPVFVQSTAVHMDKMHLYLNICAFSC